VEERGWERKGRPRGRREFVLCPGRKKVGAYPQRSVISEKQSTSVQS